MIIVFTTIFIEEAIQYVEARPSENLLIDRDLSGRYNVLDAGRVTHGGRRS